MKKTKTEIAINLIIDAVICYYLLCILFPDWRLYVKVKLQPVLWLWWKIHLAPHIREAYEVRGLI